MGPVIKGISNSAVSVEDDRTSARLEALYRRYNRPAYIEPDPLQFLSAYPDLADREIVGLIAASLAFGKVQQILRSVAGALERLPQPQRCLDEASPRDIRARCRGFRHRYVGDGELTALLLGIRRVRKEYGSLGRCFEMGFTKEDATVIPALTAFVGQLKAKAESDDNYLLPSPEKGSACKRLNLFLRWMVRRDDVDPGGWEDIPSAKLVVPLDTHMHHIALRMGWTRRKQADLRTALEITDAFRRWSPEDPVRYDFALTRLGIRTDTDMEAFLRND